MWFVDRAGLIILHSLSLSSRSSSTLYLSKFRMSKCLNTCLVQISDWEFEDEYVFRAALPKTYPRSQKSLSLRGRRPKPVQVEDSNRRLRDAKKAERAQ
jgi:hypothetical protein